MYILYYYEYDEDIEKNQFQQREEFDTLEEAQERLEELYDDEEITKNCYENAWILDTNTNRKYYSIRLDE